MGFLQKASFLPEQKGAASIKVWIYKHIWTMRNWIENHETSHRHIVIFPKVIGTIDP